MKDVIMCLEERFCLMNLDHCDGLRAEKCWCCIGGEVLESECMGQEAV